MADHLVSIYGTEKDKVNCPFYFKIGACRHGDRCSRVHNKPLFSLTLLLHNMYISPQQIMAAAAAHGLPAPQISEEETIHHFDEFYFDMHEEMSKYGSVENIYVCENKADHLAGNTYVKFRSERSAQAALEAISGRWYAGRLVHAEFSPVTDFREGKCRPFERDGRCERGDYCHFMHLRRQPRILEPASSFPAHLTDHHNSTSSDAGPHRPPHEERIRDRDAVQGIARDSPRDHFRRSHEGTQYRQESERSGSYNKKWDRKRDAVDLDRFETDRRTRYHRGYI